MTLKTPMRFDGATYDHILDQHRLTGQTFRVFNVMVDGQWHTLTNISIQTGDPEASVSARLRDLRKERFGKYTIDRERRQNLWYYRLNLDGKQLALWEK